LIAKIKSLAESKYMEVFVRVVKKKIEKKDAKEKLGGHGGKMTGDDSKRSKRSKGKE